MTLKIRKYVVYDEETLIEGFRKAETPLRMFAVAAVVSTTAPLFIMVMFFQRQIVSGLTAGAVKG